MDAAANLDLAELLEQNKYSEAQDFIESIGDLLSGNHVRTSFKKTIKQRTFWYVKSAVKIDEEFTQNWQKVFGGSEVFVSKSGDAFVVTTANFKINFKNHKPSFASFTGRDESSDVGQIITEVKKYIRECPESYPWIEQLYEQRVV